MFGVKFGFSDWEDTMVYHQRLSPSLCLRCLVSILLDPVRSHERQEHHRLTLGQGGLCCGVVNRTLVLHIHGLVPGLKRLILIRQPQGSCSNAKPASNVMVFLRVKSHKISRSRIPQKWQVGGSCQIKINDAVSSSTLRFGRNHGEHVINKSSPSRWLAERI